MLDLPAPLVEATLDWIACDACDGQGVEWCDWCPLDEPDHYVYCPRRHVVVAYEGRTIHADPDRVLAWCAHCGIPEVGRHMFENTTDCRPVLRPVVPIDLNEFASQFDATEPQFDRTWPP